MSAEVEEELAAERLAAAFNSHDAFTLLAGLTLSSSLELPSRAERLSAKLPSFVVEYAQVYAARRSTRLPENRSENLQDQAEMAGAAELMAVRGLRPLGLDKGPVEGQSGDQWGAQLALRQWQIFSHDPGPSQAERSRLTTSLGPFGAELRGALGFDAMHAEAVIESFEVLTLIGLRHVFGLTANDSDDLLGELREKAAAGEILESLPSELGEHLSFSAEMLSYAVAARGHELPDGALSAFLDRFSMPFGAVAADRDVARALWDVRERPLLHDAEGFYLLSVPYNLAFAVRPVCETALRGLSGIGARYDKQKARALETEALEELHNGLMVDGSWGTLDYPSAIHPGQSVEGDGLVLLDSVVLALECKAIELSPSARQGSAEALATKLQDTIISGAAQGQRTRRALLEEDEVTGIPLWEERREKIETGRLSRILPVVVVLEPLGAVTSALWRLVELPDSDAPWPWVVNIDDLRWFDRELLMPARLLHYMVVRGRIAASGRLGTPDEADWFWMYYSQGASAINEKIELLSQFTVTHQTQFIGPDVRRGGKLPGELALTGLEDLLVELHESRLPGWVEVAFALLDLPREHTDRIADEIRVARKTSCSGDSTWISVAPVIGDGSLLLLGVGAEDALRGELQGKLAGAVVSAVDCGAARVCALGIDATTGKVALCDWHELT